MTSADRTYSEAMQSLRDRDFRSASDIFKSVENQFAENDEFRILYESLKLLMAVKEEIEELEVEKTLG